jgi:hypothetical protein
MSELPPRPVAPVPNLAAIPAELKERRQWVVWRYQINKAGNDWTKVPYRLQTKQAASTRPEEWISYEEAVAEYTARRQTFDGIGYVFSANDPYVGGDYDYMPDLCDIPPTYAEISPSGRGIKFIARACGTYGSNKASGEIYSWGRFFTITGNVLPGHEAITECQDAVEAFAAMLGVVAAREPDGTPSEGKAGNGTRAANAAAIPSEEWQEARQIRRSKGFNRLLARLRASAVSQKTRKDDTQLGYLLRQDYRGFAERWPDAQIVRHDGSLDNSQIRACMASNIRARGFTRAEYIALMGCFFGEECLLKWNYNKNAVQEEFATLWFLGRSPRANEYAPAAPQPIKRGLGSEPSVHIEVVYQALLDHRVGTEATGTVQAFADAAGCSYRTMQTRLQELEDAGRIARRRLSHGGFVITFPDLQNETDLQIENADSADIEHIEATNERTAEQAIVAELGGAGDLQINAPVAGLSPAPSADVSPQEPSADNRDDEPHVYISTDLITNCVVPPAVCISRDRVAPPTLAQLAEHYLSTPATAIGERRVNEKTGTFVYRRSAQHFAELVLADYGSHYRHDAAIEAYKAEQARREELARQEWERFYRRLKAMSNDDLLTYVCSRLRADVADLARQGEGFDKHLYKARLEHAKKHVAWRGLEWPKRGTKLKPYTKPEVKPRPVVEQIDMLASVNVESMTERLKRLRDARRQ